MFVCVRSAKGWVGFDKEMKIWEKNDIHNFSVSQLLIYILIIFYQNFPPTSNEGWTWSPDLKPLILKMLSPLP